MTRPTFCRGTGKDSEKCDCLRCRPSLTNVVALRLSASAQTKQQYRRHGESAYDK